MEDDSIINESARKSGCCHLTEHQPMPATKQSGVVRSGITINRATYERLEALAKKRGVRRNRLMCQAIINYLKLENELETPNSA